ncbi:paired amphipathic helix protein Sin3-like 4 [Magnolia sinica]|uniref:paired amphipathic helix protein Sin3-like 4 n=1 Tax=Magnolia sinica TaxID=86752 RepID=UPI002658DE4B|nr:paired amphipathic helix protein Sin3-like 4 [Magnolia sinica]
MEGHPELFLGFIKFWHEEYNITFNDEPPEDKIAINFVDKIKVALLFREHHDLLEEFTHFLPDATGMAHLPHALPTRNSSGNFLRSADERSLVMPMVPQVHGEKLLIVCYVPLIARPESDDKGTTKVDKKQRKRKRDDKDLEHDSNRESNNGHCFSHKQKYAQTQRGHAFDHDAEQLHQVGEGAKYFGLHPILELRSKEGHLARQMKGEKNQEWFDKNGPKDVAPPKVPVLPNREKDVTAPILGLDLLKNCRIPPASQWTELEASVLKREKEGKQFDKNGANDVALPNVPVLLNEDVWPNQSWSLTSRTVKAVTLVIVIIQRKFKLDTLLKSANEAVRCVEQLIEKMNDNTIKPSSPIHVEDHFTGPSLRCIEKLYYDSGLDMLNLLQNNASAASPVILARLKQKQEELLKCHSDLNKAWAEVYAKNHPNRSTV